jgi:hypothetical protein
MLAILSFDKTRGFHVGNSGIAALTLSSYWHGMTTTFAVALIRKEEDEAVR